MEQTVLQAMKGSEYHKIIAAVLEIMEKAQFESNANVSLSEKKDSDKWEMSFVKKSTDLDELLDIKTELGDNFNIRIEPGNNKQISICVEAPCEDFTKLIGAKLPTAGRQKNIFDKPETESPMAE